ncbi:type II toxin-antitoxin system RelE/ParE family toxin [Candidatus Woesearchaeota archaeon]|nr:type II toxin-antitoxin system RelE/ParE family toxin [Candidatus Woesearchaeota archaeon]
MDKELTVKQSERFSRILEHTKDKQLKIRVFKQIEKILINPDVGKPMMRTRKGTRELYIKPFRLSYCYSKEDNEVTLLDLYHKDEQ